MRKTIAAAVMLAALGACGGSEEGDVSDLPGVDASGTADTELFTAAEQALTNVVGRLARLVFQIEHKLQQAE